jgi:hypothetical protein
MLYLAYLKEAKLAFKLFLCKNELMCGSTTRFIAVNVRMVCEIHLQLVFTVFTLNSIHVFAMGFSFH